MSLEYKGFTLDPFQEEAIASINNGNSVVVSAATGTGKTLIADYVVEQAIKNNQQVIYTAPIKALSNQKFRDFTAEYGEHIGLMTGDVVIRPDAPVRIMTTEIYRNMLMDGEQLDQLAYVIFDEIHYINDPDRGTVWEESIIFSDDHVRFLCLSATIPNYRQFADWIQHIKGHTVDTVHYAKRAVPLAHHIYDAEIGLGDLDELGKAIERTPNKRFGKRDRRGKKKKIKALSADHRDLIRELKSKSWLPCIYFAFSRAATMDKAKECARAFDFVSNHQRAEIIETFNKIVKKDIRSMHSVQDVRYLVSRGVGVHHAGILPPLKEAVEKLFAKGLIKVLYATETFAIGINMPAKAVCFHSLMKFDGRSFRMLHSKEYFQMAGRAGRRGLDKEGNAISLIDRGKVDVPAMKKLWGEDVEPIISQFNLSYNTVLNLIGNYDAPTREVILQSNFGYFVKKQSKQQVRVMTSFANLRRRLELLEFVKGEQLTWKGKFASHMYTKEIAVSEFVFDEIFTQLDDKQLLLVLTALVYESKPMNHFVTKGAFVSKIVRSIEQNREVSRTVNYSTLKRLYHLVYLWYDGAQFEELLEVCNLAEGDIIRLFRQSLDLMSQMKHALIRIQHYDELIDRLDALTKIVDRDLVAVEF